jgi:hypothetical protein
MRRAALAAVAGLLAAAATAPVSTAVASPPSRPTQPKATGIALTAPVRDVDPLKNAIQFGVRKDRLLTSVVPGPVRNTELVTALIGPSGAPVVVTDRQRLVITAPGTYIVRELGPARKADGLGDTVPPVLELGQVVWQGFSPNTRTLEAMLTLDAGIEAHRLPMTVTLRFRDSSGRVRTLRPGGQAPADGTLDVTLANQTASPRVVLLGTGSPVPTAAALDVLYDAAQHPATAVPPYAGGGLPAKLPGTPGGGEQLEVVAPLRVTGTVGVAEATTNPVRGPGITPRGNGASVAGTLDGTATFQVAMRAGQHLVADLDVRPWLDPRLLAPPASSWRAWAAGHPSTTEVTSVTRTLAEAAAAAARSAEYSPYLQADTPGADLSTFHYAVAPKAATPRAGAVLTVKPAGVAAALLALAAIAGNAALLWRRL